jgi:predicted nucleic acid-binding protein
VTYLLDTNVVGELRKRRGDSGVKKWVAGQSAADLAVSVVTIIEIQTGILRKQRTDPEKGPHPHPMVRNNVLTGFSDRILPLDLAAARRVASLHVPDQAPQHDALIAGTALARGLTVVTRTRAFERAGVEYLSPWSDS